MENSTTSVNENNTNQIQQSVPNSTGILVMGILSIVTCCVAAVPGVVLGIIALVMSGKSKALYNENPEMYTLSSYKNMNAGRVCAIVGTIISSLYLLYLVIYIVFIGAVAGSLLTQFPWDSF